MLNRILNAATNRHRLGVGRNMNNTPMVLFVPSSPDRDLACGSAGDVEAICRLFLDRHDALIDSCATYQAAWEKVGPDWMAALTGVLEENWPPIPAGLTCFVGFCRTCPRNLSKNWFLVPAHLSAERLIQVAAHEVLHFLYFRKVAMAMPHLSPAKYEFPHLPWLLSEIMAPIIMNDSRLTGIIPASSMNTYACKRDVLSLVAVHYERRREDGVSFALILHEAMDLLRTMETEGVLHESS